MIRAAKVLSPSSNPVQTPAQNAIIFLRAPPSSTPLTSFDVVVAEEMKQMLKSIKKDHIIIFSTHIMELALDLCDEIVILNKGYLEKINMNDIDKEETKERIIQSLKEEKNV